MNSTPPVHPTAPTSANLPAHSAAVLQLITQSNAASLVRALDPTWCVQAIVCGRLAADCVSATCRKHRGPGRRVEPWTETARLFTDLRALGLVALNAQQTKAVRRLARLVLRDPVLLTCRTPDAVAHLIIRTAWQYLDLEIRGYQGPQLTPDERALVIHAARAAICRAVFDTLGGRDVGLRSHSVFGTYRLLPGHHARHQPRKTSGLFTKTSSERARPWHELRNEAPHLGTTRRGGRGA